MPDAIRTPDEILAELPDFPFEPSFRELDGLRLAHLDVGDGPPVVFLAEFPMRIPGRTRDASTTASANSRKNRSDAWSC